MKHNLLLLLCITSSMLLHAKDIKLDIIYIGNSITQGALLATPELDAPPAQSSMWLQKQSDIDSVKWSNQGISGATTVDFLPVSQTYFPKVIQAVKPYKTDQHKTLIFSVMLGTNDSAVKGTNGAPVSPEQYYTNMKAILDDLISLYPNCLIILHRPIWYSPNTYNSAIYLKDGLERLTNYLPKLELLVEKYQISNPNRIFIGDTDAFDYYKNNYLTDFTPEDGNAGTFYLHPNKKGAAKLGEFWGKAIYKIVENRIKK
ncbi:MAG: GDSL-type esterase/lipase family protein [Bacteroidales bacterium]